MDWKEDVYKTQRVKNFVIGFDFSYMPVLPQVYRLVAPISPDGETHPERRWYYVQVRWLFINIKPLFKYWWQTDKKVDFFYYKY